MAMYERILVPIDGSPRSDDATDHSVGIAKAMGSAVVFLFVIDTVHNYQEGVMPQVLRALAEEGTACLERAKNIATAAGAVVDVELLEGDPVEVIVDRAQDFDLLVMASTGKGLWKRLTVGSVTEAVLRRSPCPILIVVDHASGRPVATR
jgi:nucleotide-binding universal stress UspA family protein